MKENEEVNGVVKRLREERSKEARERDLLQEKLAGRQKEIEELSDALSAKGRGEEAEMMRKIQQREDEVREVRSQLNSLSMEFGEAKAAWAAKEEAREKEFKESARTCEGLEQDLVVARTTLKETDEVLGQIKRQLEQKTLEANGAESELSKSRQEKTNLEKEMQQSIEELKLGHEETLRELHGKMQKVAEEQGAKIDEEIKQLQSRIKEEQEQEISAINQRNAEAVRERDARIGELEERVKRQQEEKEEAGQTRSEEVTRLRDELATLNDTLRKEKEAHDSLANEEVTRLRDELAALCDTLKKERETHDSLANETKGLREANAQGSNEVSYTYGIMKH